jgi:putative ABC transport system permease protein
MTTLRMLWAEIGYRKVNFGMGLLAVLSAVTMFVAGPMLLEGYRRQTEAQVAQLRSGIAEFEAKTRAELGRLESETTRLMRDMGFNLLIVPAETDMSDFWSADFAAAAMPEQYVKRLAADRRLTYVTHLVATLNEKIDWEHRKVLVTGYLPESTQSHMQHKTPMGYRIEPGTVWLGHELGAGRKTGQTLAVKGRNFRIARMLPEQGSKEDITIAMHLADAQAVLGKPGKINQILALGCNCAGSNLPNIRTQLAEVLPQTRVTEFRSIALARAEQRALVEAKRQSLHDEMTRNLKDREQVLAEHGRLLEALADVATPLVVLASAVWVGLLALANVRQRRMEIGLLRALGKGPATIWGLFLGKAAVLGALGAAAGCAVGWAVARWLGADALGLSPQQLPAQYRLFFSALLGAPAVCIVASYLPTLSALLEDPTAVLRE